VIPASFVELHRLQSAALAELQRLDLPVSALLRASTPGELLGAAYRAADMIHAARQVALRLPRDAYGRALDLTQPAALAIEDLRLAAFEEFMAKPERLVG
jgi:hypothetical protein